jgi:hypothetical protein
MKIKNVVKPMILAFFCWAVVMPSGAYGQKRPPGANLQ